MWEECKLDKFLCKVEAVELYDIGKEMRLFCRGCIKTTEVNSGE
jgi:hypothetical protein